MNVRVGTAFKTAFKTAACILLLGAPIVAQQAVFRGSATVIEVDVIVRDKARNFVGDLQTGDFEVFEDGVRQEVSAVYRVVGPGEKVTAGASDAAPLPAPPPQQVQRVFIFFFDQAHIQVGGFDRAKKAALEFIKTDFRQGDVGGILNGGTMVNNRLTTSREELTAALSSIKPGPEGTEVNRALRQWPRITDLYEAWRIVRHEPAPGTGGSTTVLDQVVARACAEQPSSCSGGGGGATALVEGETQNKAIQLVAQARLLSKQTLDTISGLTGSMSRLPGRKTVIMLTEGFWLEDAMSELRAVADKAARASVRIYSLDTRGLNRGSASSEILMSAAPQQQILAGPSMGDVEADGPNALAVDTGGFVIRNQNDFGKAFQDIDRDTSSYYVVGFRTSQQLDGKFHALEVKVKRPGVTVRGRKGYVASPDLAKPQATQPAKGGDSAAPANAAPAAAAGTGVAAPPTEAAPITAGVATGAAPTELAGALRIRPDVPTQVAALEPNAGAKASAPFPADLMKRARDGWAAYQKGAVGDAQKALEPAAAHTAAPPWVVYVLGWTQYAQSQVAASAVSWERVRAAVPEFNAVYFDLADAYLQQRDFGKAVDVLRVAEKRWPKDVEVYNALGVVQLVRGALDDAIATFEKAVTVQPADATAAYNLAKTSEMRFIRASRQRKAGPGSIQMGPMFQDRDRAVDYYKRVIALGGPFVEQSKEGLKRLNVQ